MLNEALKAKIEEWKKQSGIANYTPENCEKAAREFKDSIEEYRKNHNEDLTKEYIRIRKGYDVE